jgi:hypothetical protein
MDIIFVAVASASGVPNLLLGMLQSSLVISVIDHKGEYILSNPYLECLWTISVVRSFTCSSRLISANLEIEISSFYWTQLNMFYSATST